jgi:hypothetical protein
MGVYIKNTERSQINDLMLHIKFPGKQERAKSKNNGVGKNKKQGLKLMK